MNWLADTTQDYRRGFVEGESGERNVYLLEAGVKDSEQYAAGYRDGERKRLESEADRA